MSNQGDILEGLLLITIYNPPYEEKMVRSPYLTNGKGKKKIYLILMI
jgi:hypothetical protein